MRARFIGDPRHGGEGPALLTFMGVEFVKDVWVEDVPAPCAIKVSGNSHFATDGEALTDAEIDAFVAPVVEAAIATEAADAPEEAASPPGDPLDRDGDGNIGGSLPVDEPEGEAARIIADLVALGKRKPHPATKIEKLRAMLEAATAPQ